MNLVDRSWPILRRLMDGHAWIYRGTNGLIGQQRRDVRARVATPEERRRLWPKAIATYAGSGGYQERTQREIPLVILEPPGAQTAR